MKFDEDLIGNSKGALETLVSDFNVPAVLKGSYLHRSVLECPSDVVQISRLTNLTCPRVTSRKKRSGRPKGVSKGV